MRRIYLEPPGVKLHSFYDALISSPPEGYEFITFQTHGEKIASKSREMYLMRSFHYLLWKTTPLTLITSYLKKFKKIPKDIDLTYSSFHLVFREEPWIIDVETINQILGCNSPKYFNICKKVIEKAFSSVYCKKILCYFEKGMETVLLNLDCTHLKDKIEKVYPAVPKKNFTKEKIDDKIKLLFVGSTNIPGEFILKGGNYALNVFKQLNKKYDDLELVIRSDMPNDMKNKYKKFTNIKIIDRIISQEQLEYEFKSSDIFLCPPHETPFLAILEAMSYELPVVTIDAWANSELVEDGKTGFVVSKSEKIPYYYKHGFHPNWWVPEFNNAIRTVDAKVLREAVEKTSLLIEDENLRRRMGRVGRREIEQGKFSIERRNEKLKKIFDEAIG